MAALTDTERLSRPERLRVVILSLIFLFDVSLLGWLLWSSDRLIYPLPIWNGFWQPMPSAPGRIPRGVYLLQMQCARTTQIGPYQMPTGIPVLVALFCYFMIFTLGWLAFFGFVQGLRGRPTRFTAWLLRAASGAKGRMKIQSRKKVYIPTSFGLLLVALTALVSAVILWTNLF